MSNVAPCVATAYAVYPHKTCPGLCPLNFRANCSTIELSAPNCQGILYSCRAPVSSHVVRSPHSALFPRFHWDTGDRKPTTREYTSQRVRPISPSGTGAAGGIGSRSQCVCGFFMPSSKCSDQCSAETGRWRRFPSPRGSRSGKRKRSKKRGAPHPSGAPLPFPLDVPREPSEFPKSSVSSDPPLQPLQQGTLPEIEHLPCRISAHGHHRRFHPDRQPQPATETRRHHTHEPGDYHPRGELTPGKPLPTMQPHKPDHRTAHGDQRRREADHHSCCI